MSVSQRRNPSLSLNCFDNSVWSETRSVIRWSGVVPPQKWMNFYTKVVGRFANTPGLSISVTFTVPADQEQSKAKTEETRSALKELGLDDSVSAE